jgi:hypothetical protein
VSSHNHFWYVRPLASVMGSREPATLDDFLYECRLPADNDLPVYASKEAAIDTLRRELAVLRAQQREALAGLSRLIVSPDGPAAESERLKQWRADVRDCLARIDKCLSIVVAAGAAAPVRPPPGDPERGQLRSPQDA